MNVETSDVLNYCGISEGGWFMPSGSGTQYVHCGSGTYYLNISSAGAGSYSLEIDDYTPISGSVKGASVASSGLHKKVNAIFRSVYGRNPTPPENRYWLSRIKDKPTEQALTDAMKWHKLNGIRH